MRMSSVTQLILQATREKSDQVIRENCILRLSKEDAEKIITSLEHPPKPTAYMLKSVKEYGNAFPSEESEGL